MEKKIKYLDDWKDWSRDQKDNLDLFDRKRWAELCIANITVRNTKMCIFAFLYYAKDLLNNSPTVIFFHIYIIIQVL